MIHFPLVVLSDAKTKATAGRTEQTYQTPTGGPDKTDSPQDLC